MRDEESRLVAALADRYVIARELGAGGMATVYLANNVKHHRQLAVKVLRSDLTATLAREHELPVSVRAMRYRGAAATRCFR